MLLRVASAVLILGLLAAGCSSGGGGDDGAPPRAGGSTTAAPTGTASAGSDPTASPTPALPTGCETLLPFTDLDRALGRPLFGESRFTKGVGQPSIGRTGRATCQYGLGRGGTGVPYVEVGISTYTDAEAAAKRVRATVAAARADGATQGEATVGGVPATLLGGGKTVTLVLAEGSRTVAVTVQRSLASTLGTGITLNRATTSIAEKVRTNLAE